MVKNTEIMERIARTDKKVDKAFEIIRDVQAVQNKHEPTMNNLEKVFQTGGPFDKLVTLVSKHDVKIDNHEQQIKDLKLVDKSFEKKERSNLIGLISFLVGLVMFALGLWSKFSK